MIRYIKLKNFRSYTDLDLNLTSKNGDPLKFAVIYGENGSGKSNIVKVFDVLYDSFQTMNLKSILMHLLEDHPNQENTKKASNLKSYTDITRIIKENKTADSSSNMLIDIGFCFDEKKGSYLLEFDSDKIIHERLEYTLAHNRGVYFDITENSQRINSSVFFEFKNDLSILITKFWGKHSVISLLNNAKEEYSESFFNSNLSTPFLRVLTYLNSICVYMADKKVGIFNDDSTFRPNMYAHGEIPISAADKLELHERMLNNYFKSMYKNIRKVYYEKEQINDRIKYDLYFTRLISGEERNIHHINESSGTRNLIYLFPYCLAATRGLVVAVDEIDNGIHDVLLCNMLKSLYKSISGQVILTTHNTLLLNEFDFKDSFFFIEIDDNGSSKLNKPSDFGYRIQPNSNVVLNYMQNRFKGLPWTEMNIDFEDISSTS